MSKNVTAVLGLTAFDAPAGTIPGNFRVALIDAADNTKILQQVDTADLTVTFQNIAPGSYMVAAVRLDATGLAIGKAAVSTAFTIPPDAGPATVSIDVPASVTVTVA